MISHPYLYLGILALLAASGVFMSKKAYPALKYLPPIVLLYMSVMILSSWGLFDTNDEITKAYSTLKGNLLPAMLFLMLLPNKISALLTLGPKMLLSFFLASLSLFLAFIVCFVIFSLGYHDIEILAPLCGSWMGGTGNMLAVSAAVNASESAVGVTMLVDSVDYALWVMFLLLLVPFAPLFNRFVNANDPIKDIVLQSRCALHFSYRAYFWLLFTAMAVSLFSQVGAIFLSQSYFGPVNTWSVILATLLGIAFSFTPLGKIKGIQGSANAMLYLLIALIASRADIKLDLGLLSYLLIGMSVLFVHALLMLMFARLFRLDLFSISVASLANIGGIASAPILSAAYAQSLVGVGVIMATLGYVIGTFGALALSAVLKALV